MPGKHNASAGNEIKLLQRASKSFVIAGRAAKAAAPGEAAFTAGKRLLQRILPQLRKPTRVYVYVAEFCQYNRPPEAEITSLRSTRAEGRTEAVCRHFAPSL